MGWIRVEDDFYDNDKMFTAGSIGRDLYWHGMAFCNRNLTDGLVPKGRALTLVDFTDAAVLVNNYGGVDGQECAPIAIERLLTAELWHEDGHDCPDCVQPGPWHYVVHDYLKYQPSRADVEAKAEANRKRVQEWRDARKGGNTVGNVLHTEHVQPTPNPTPSTSMVTKEGRVTKVDARETKKSPPPICTSHPNDPEKPCQRCKRRRVWEEQHAEIEAKAAVEQREKRRQLAVQTLLECPDCDEYGWLLDVEPATKCGRHPIVKVAAV